MGPRQGQQLEGKGQAWFSIAVVIRFEGAIAGHAQVLGLLLSQLGQLHIQLAQVGFSDCFIQLGRNTEKAGISAMLWDPLAASSCQKRQGLFCCDVCRVLSILLHSILTASLRCGFWLLSSPSSRGDQATSSPPSSPNGTVNYISFLTLHQPKQLTKMLLWNLSMDRTSFHDRGFQDS